MSNALFDKVLDSAEPYYAPSGWYEIIGETGKTALIWSLCSWRNQINHRKTLLVELGEPYDYHQVALWSDVPLDSLVLLTSQQSILDDVLTLIQETGLEIGQIIFENLGFLLGSGRQESEVESFLGPPSGLFKLKSIAQERDIALFATTYEVFRYNAIGPKQSPLGGSMLTNLCQDQRLRMTRLHFIQKAGRHIGERFSIVNLKKPKERYAELTLRYTEGPLKVRITP